MRAPNKHQCVITWHKETALDAVGVILHKIVPKLREADAEDTVLFFTLEPTEERYISKFYEGRESVAQKFLKLLNEALEREDIPYELSTGLGDINNHMYGFRVRGI
jgi:hypothetical protein